MANAVIPRWHGDNYQSRLFWENAFNLLDPGSCVAEVTFEADGPKAFDDVVVKYDPPVVRSGPGRVRAEYHQIKWHVAYGGRFGFKDFTSPEFIGAQRFSLLERLQQARAAAEPGSRFSLVTVHRIRDDDPLAELVSGHDKSLLTEKLFDGTTPRSRMGKVRQCWREHLGLSKDDDLRELLTGFRVLEGHRSLEEMRQQLNLKAQAVGLVTCPETQSEFRYDELARQLKVRGLHALTRETFEQFCREEGLLTGRREEQGGFLPVAIRSFLGPAADIVGASPENTLVLTDDFRQRYLRDSLGWQRDIRPKVEGFLRDAVRRSSRLRLILDAHASIAFLAGSVLDLKSGVATELVQKGRVGARTWRADDGSAARDAPLRVTHASLGRGREIVAALSLTQATEVQARAYAEAHLPEAGTLVSFTPPMGPSQHSVAGGEHASVLAGQVSNVLREFKAREPDVCVHLFAACPNSVLFFLGQQHQGIAPCIVYEFDFDRRGHKGYQPSFVIA